MSPTLRQLEYLVALADCLSFGDAARRCHVSQPGLSLQLKELETRLGLRLFERDRRSVVPTPAGRALVARARDILTAVGDLEQAARALRAPFTGELRLGVIPTVAPFALPRLLPELRRCYPKLRLRLREDQTAVLVRAAEEGRLDLLLLAREAELGSLHALDLYRDPFRVAVAEGHALTRHEHVTEAELASQELLLLEDGHCLRDQALSFCARRGAPRVGDLRASSLGTLLGIVAAGDDVTLLPEIARPLAGHATTPIRLLPLQSKEAFRTICLAWRPSDPRAPEYTELAELFVEHAPAGVAAL